MTRVLLFVSLVAFPAAAQDTEAFNPRSWTKEALIGLRTFALRPVVNQTAEQFGITETTLAAVAQLIANGRGFETIKWKSGRCGKDCSGLQMFVSITNTVKGQDNAEWAAVHARVVLTDDAMIRDHLAHTIFYEEFKNDLVKKDELAAWLSTRLQQMLRNVVETAYAINHPPTPANLQ